MQVENSNENVVLLDRIAMIDTSDVMVGVEVATFANLLSKMLKSEMKDKTILTLRDEDIVVISKLLETSPDYFNDIELSLLQVIKDNKIDTSDIPIIITLIEKLYKLIYKIDVVKLDSKKRCEMCSSILKFLIHALVEERKIKIDDENKILFLISIDSLIDSFIGLVRLPKEIKTNKCINLIFGKK